MSKIGWGQLGIALALSRIFAESVNFPRDDINYGMQRFTVLLLSYALLAAVMLPVFVMLKKLPGENIFSAAALKSPAAAKVLAVTYCAALLTMMITAAVQLEFYSGSTIFDAAPAWLVLLFAFIACIYGTVKGLPAAVRAGVIAACGFALLLILVIIGTAGDIRPDRLYPALAERPDSLLPEVLSEFSKNSEAAVFVSLCSRVRSDAHRSLIVCGTLSLAAMLIMTFLYNTVLGEHLDAVSFPFYRLASLSDVSLFQRLDGVDAAVWTTSAIIKLTLMSAAVRGAVKSAFGSSRAAGVTAMCSLLLTALAALFFSRHTVDFVKLSLFPETGVFVFLTAALLPAAGLLLGLSAKKAERRKAN